MFSHRDGEKYYWQTLPSFYPGFKKQKNQNNYDHNHDFFYNEVKYIQWQFDWNAFFKLIVFWYDILDTNRFKTNWSALLTWNPDCEILK